MEEIISTSRNSSVLSVGRGALFIQVGSTQASPQSEDVSESGNRSDSQVENQPNEDAAVVSLSDEVKNVRTTSSSEDSQQKAELSEEEKKEIEKLKERDREVKDHEQAHLSSLGQYRGGAASYVFQTGPDGQRYAVGGEVGVDLSEEDSPEETITKMQVVERAAMAPADPSSQDRQVAAQAGRIESQARSEEAKAQSQDTSKVSDNTDNKDEGISEVKPSEGKGKGENSQSSVNNAQPNSTTENNKTSSSTSPSTPSGNYQARLASLNNISKSSGLHLVA